MLQIVMVLAIMGFAISLIIACVQAFNEVITEYLYEKEEYERREYMRIRNHKHSRYVYITHPNGMTEIVKRESV